MKDEIDTSTSSGLCKKIFHNFKLSIKNFAKYFYGQGLLTKVSTFIAGLGVIIAAILGGNQIIQEIIKTKQIKNEIQIQLSVGDRFFEQYEYERAIIEYNKILEIDNNNIPINSRIITAMRNKFQLQEKIKKQDIDNVLAQIYKIQAINPDSKNNLKLLIEEAFLLKINKRFHASISILEKAQNLDPQNPVILAELGYLRGLTSIDNNHGLDLIHQAIKLQPKEARFHFYSAELAVKTKLDAEAIRSYYQVAKLAINQDTWSKGVRKNALNKLLIIFYRYGNKKSNFPDVISSELKMPLNECAIILEYYIANNQPIRRDSDEDPFLYLSQIYFNLGNHKKAIQAIQAGLPEEKKNWRHWGQLLAHYIIILEKSGLYADTLLEIRTILDKGVSYTSKSLQETHDDFFIGNFLK